MRHSRQQAIDLVLEINLLGAVRTLRLCLPHVLERRGYLLAVASVAAIGQAPGMAAYCASKAALDHFAQCLMLEVRQQGIKVTTLAPGSVDTAFGGREEGARGRDSWMLRPEDVAGAVLDLLRTRDDAHLSRVEMRPLRPQKRA